MVKTIVVARDMIRQLGEFVNTCDSLAPSSVYDAVERVDEAFNDKEIDYSTLMTEKQRIEELARMFHKKCSCQGKK